MFAWLGLIVTLLIWACLATLLTRWRDGKLGSISAHGSSTRGASLLFKVILAIGGPVFYWWLVGWFVPHLQLPAIFTVILTIVVVYQIATGAEQWQSRTQ